MRSALDDKKIASIVRQAVASSIFELFDDPDIGLQLRSFVKKQLIAYRRKGKNQKRVLFSEIKRKYL